MPTNSDSEEGIKYLVYKMSMYLAKMTMHDYELSGRKQSLVGIGALYVALKICEQLKKNFAIITPEIVAKLVKAAKA